jgi:hypothetical protein
MGIESMSRVRNIAVAMVVAVLCVGMITACYAEGPQLDLTDYYRHSPGGDNVYPTEEQLEMLKAVMPAESYQPAPPISDRGYWDKIAATASGQEHLKTAVSNLDEEPEVPITDEIYRRANLEGNRRIYKPRYYRTMERLETFILAECMENKGRFLPQVVTYLDSIMAMKSWLHPNHDTDDNRVLEGRGIAIDLGARKFGTDLALVEVLLGDKLSSDRRQEMADHLQRRIIDCYLKSCSGEIETNLSWRLSTSNWNSVCTSGSLFVILATSKDPEERLVAMGCALNSMTRYLSGFGQDGYCSEGVGYWGYGFGHYLYLAQTVYDYSDGKIDLFDAGNSEKLKNVGTFPQRYEMHKGMCAPISDGVSRVRFRRNFATVMSANHYGARKPPEADGPPDYIDDEAAYQLIMWSHPDIFTEAHSGDGAPQELPGTTYFDGHGMVISRGRQEVPLSIAIKAGHNQENHNHSDVGTYSIFLDTDHVTGDIGAPSYRAGSFAKDNPARSSWGHPVPRINDTLQSNGIEFAGTITETDFTEGRDWVVMDIKGAYEVPGLRSLTRTMENDRSTAGTITIRDRFTAENPVIFGVAIMTLEEYEIIDDNTVILRAENQSLRAEISSTGGSFKIKDELVPVEHLREGAPAYRIGVDFVDTIREGSITIRYTPAL